jgi:hypothetical protein
VVKSKSLETLNDIFCPSGAVDDVVHIVDPIVLKVDGEHDTDVAVGMRTVIVLFSEAKIYGIVVPISVAMTLKVYVPAASCSGSNVAGLSASLKSFIVPATVPLFA